MPERSADIEIVRRYIVSPYSSKTEADIAWDALERLNARAELGDHFAGTLVERWHTSVEDCVPFPAGGSLAQFMDLTDEQYAAWVECRFEDVLALGKAAR